MNKPPPANSPKKPSTRKFPLQKAIGTQRSLSSIQLPVDFIVNPNAVKLFSYETSQFIYNLRTATASSSDMAQNNSESLKDTILSSWEQAKEQKMFNYCLNCLYKLLPGYFNFSIQLNTERALTRRKPIRCHSVRQPFNSMRWNFTKLNEKEILFHFRCKDQPLLNDPLDRHILAINAAPLERGHSLILPSINRLMPQVLNEVSIKIAVHFMLLIDDDSFHVTFNSLLGFASVNHLHLHALFWPYDADIVNRRCESFSNDFYVVRRPAWCSQAIIFQLTSADSLQKFISNILKCVEFLSTQEIAHNVFFARAQPVRTNGEIWSEDTDRTLPQLVTAYVFPRVSVPGAKPTASICTASFELAGCLTACSIRFFESVSEETILRILDEEAILPGTLFNRICSEFDDYLCGRQPETRMNDDIPGNELTQPELEELRDSFKTFELHSPRRFYGNDKGMFQFSPSSSTEQQSHN